MSFDLYKGDDRVRFVLGRAGSNSLAIFGINPSKADEYNSDSTMDKIGRLVREWDFDGFVMFNLYPLRSSKPKNLPDDCDVKLLKRNAEIVCEELQRLKVRLAWAAWGDAFNQRPYFKICLGEILSKTKGLNLKWKNCESLTRAKNPRHPLSGRPHVITERSQLVDFSVKRYFKDE